ncbi:MULTISPECIES: ABC transporter permease [Niastella]|uniref:ABC transporter permease n=1 Tax=Niastella soli TaxID=2821487 RepID=A0ABS3YX54_9BACT|nr:ABC transporter permease [Niastella soli]MBO9202501.1 ABC transporter permease [Niastella soli]
MLRNYLLLAIKNCRKQKMFSVINVLGLTVGIVCCLMIFLFIMNEFSYDRFHKNGEHIYRVMRRSHMNGDLRNIPYLAPPYAKALKNDYPDAIQQAVRIFPDNDLVTYNNISFNEKKVFLADNNFFQFFSFRLLKGNPATVLKDPNSIVMTASTAKKYFGKEDPIGKVISFNKKTQRTVTGIAEDVPANSHLEFDIVVPTANWENTPFFNQWTNNGVFVYVQLNPAVQPTHLMKLFPAFMERYLGEWYRKMGFKNDLILQPLHGIYFDTDSPFDHEVKHGSKKMVYIFMSIAILILVIACINFMNLSTARATDRSKEVGVRKVMGAVRTQLAWQFIFESLLFATVAAISALLLLQLIMPAYTGFLGYTLPAYWTNPWIYVFTVGVILVIGLLAGSYPALMLSSFSPIESLKGKLKTGKQGTFFREALVVFQFGISVLLTVCVAVVMKQMHFVRNTDLGFSKEQSMIVRLDNGAIWDKKIQFKTQAQADPAVAAVSLMSGEPGGFHDNYSFEAEGHPGEKLMFNTEFADFEYVKTLGLKIIAGRDFSPAFITDSTSAVLINRTAAVQLGYTPQQAVGKWINVTGVKERRTIVGVVEDYHFTSLKTEIAPLVISTQKDDRRLVLIRLNTDNIPAAVARIKKLYDVAAPDYPFAFDFLDERFNKLYKAEIKQESLLSIFSIIAIGIACLGLFGLASYTAIKRTKEIGVRKVLGSSVENIVLLLSKDLLKPVLLGTVIAIPVGFFVMQNWLQNFAYRTTIHWWLFLVAATVAVFIALLTVSVQAINAALVNPVKSLRTDQ